MGKLTNSRLRLGRNSGQKKENRRGCGKRPILAVVLGCQAMPEFRLLSARFHVSHLAAGVCRCGGTGSVAVACFCVQVFAMAMKDNNGKVQVLAMRAVDAARACGVSERTFSGWLKSENPPPHFRRGGCVLVPTRELTEWLSGQLSDGANT